MREVPEMVSLREKAQMVQMCMPAQISSAQKEECRTQACSAQSPSEGLAHPLFLKSRPPPHLQDASVLAPGPVPVVAQLS